MSASLRVISPGLLTTIQDRGRSGFQHLGVPESGALDCAALAAANRTDVQLVSFDLDPVCFQMVKDGKILGLVVQDPFKMGYEGINAMVTKLQGGKPVERMDIPTRILTKENAAEFASDPQITGG